MEYSNQSRVYILGAPGAPITLTNNYADNISRVIDMGHWVEATYYIEYVGTIGDTLKLKFEGSPDESYDAIQKFGQEMTETVAGGTITLTPGERVFVKVAATDNVKFFAPPADKLMRISAKETAAGAHGTLILRALLSGK